MLTIRLQRVGRKNDPSFRVVVAESKKSAKSGDFVEVVGAYDARQGKPLLKGERIKHWLSVGATVSDTVHNLLVRNKIIEGKKINLAPIPKPKEAPAPAAPEQAAAEAPVAEEKSPEASAEETPVAEESVPTETSEEEKAAE